MKKFFTIIPLQLTNQLDPYHYTAVDNSKLAMEGETRFPIMAAINGYAQAGEEIRIIAVASDVEATRENRAFFEEEVAAMCRNKGLKLPRGVEYILVPKDDRVAVQVSTFQRLIDLVDDEDELYACVTYGTKPMSMALMMAVQYAYRVKENASISCIIYGFVDRPSKIKKDWKAYMYDMTALVQMDELVRVLAEQRVADPKRVIDRMLSL